MTDATTIPLSIIVLITGDFLDVESSAADLLSGIGGIDSTDATDAEWVLVLDGPHWSKALAPSAWVAAASNRRFAVLPRAKEHLGVLANHGLGAARGEFVTFLWPGCDPAAALASARLLREKAVAEGWSFAAGQPAPAERQKSLFESTLASPDQVIRGYHRGWLQMQNLVPMGHSVFRRDLALEHGGFSPSRLLQRHAWWEFTLRLSRTITIEMVADAVAPPCRWGWLDYPFRSALPVSGDMAARLLMQGMLPRRMIDDALEVNDDGVDSFASDLDPARAERLRRFVSPNGSTVDGGARRPLRIAVIGGVHEPAHNQLVFFNYFQLVGGQGGVNWRTLLDTAARPSDLEGCDLVIFSRIRTEPGCRLLDFCTSRGIATIYMIDDNWFWIGRDVPEIYGKMFAPDAPSTKNFLHCLRTADIVLTYNRFLAEDLAPHARKVHRMNTNINLAQFPRRLRGEGSSPVIGYVGSTRWVPGAYDGLVAAARERPQARVFFMTNTPPDAMKQLPPEQVTYHPYVYSYERYAQIVSEAAPDILVAPLQDGRYMNSKCPNKYLEITAAGAVGVYSRVEPYASVVEDGVTGLFAEEGAASWKAAILRLIDDAPLRRSIAAQALAHVEREYKTESVLPQFMEFLRETAQKKSPPQASPAGAGFH